MAFSGEVEEAGEGEEDAGCLFDDHDGIFGLGGVGRTGFDGTDGEVFQEGSAAGAEGLAVKKDRWNFLVLASTLRSARTLRTPRTRDMRR